MPSFSALTTCVKYLMFFFNLLFVITGIIVISVGAAVQAEFHGYTDILDEPFRSVPALLIAIGVLIFIIAFFGCCGAIKESYWMILTFSVLMIIIFILEIAAGISGFVLRDQAYDSVRVSLKNSMKNYQNNGSSVILWDNLQTEFTCCGTDKPSDWQGLLTVNGTTNNTLPISCCPRQSGIVGTLECNLDVIHFEKGCVYGLSDYLSSHASSLGAVGVCIGIIQFIGILFACHLARRTKYETTE